MENFNVVVSMRNQVACEGRTDTKSVQWEQTFVVDVPEADWKELLGRQLAIEYNRFLGIAFPNRAELYEKLTKGENRPLPVTVLMEELENQKKGSQSPEDRLRSTAKALLNKGLSKEEILRLVMGE